MASTSAVELQTSKFQIRCPDKRGAMPRFCQTEGSPTLWELSTLGAAVCCHSKSAVMNDVHPEALPLIFAYLPHLEDFVYCSLACKSWAVAVLQARPKCLTMPHLSFDCPYDSAAELISRLQVWQKRSGLRQLKHLLLQDV